MIWTKLWILLSACVYLEAAQVKQCFTSYALDVYKKSFDDSSNMIISPYSIRSMLISALPTAIEKVKTKMADVLKVEPNKAMFKRNQVIRQMFEKNPSITIKDTIYVQKGQTLHPRYEAVSKKRQYQKLMVRYTDFANKKTASKAINEWASGESNGKIKKIINPNRLSQDTKFVLLNLIYFKANWQYPFDPRNTADDKFKISKTKTVTAPMMYQSYDNALRYLSKKGLFEFVELPYETSSEFAMWLFLPAKGKELKDLQAQLTSDILESVAKEAKPRKLDVFLPKFKFNYDFDVKNVLKAQGLESLFKPGALRIVQDNSVKMSDVFQQAFIQVDEIGTEATAATAGVALSRSLPYTLKFDRPFLFMIVRPCGSPIFIGHYVNPNKQ